MMMLIRRFEEKAAEMYARGKIKGFLHLYIGQEAVATGVISALRPDDYIYTHYREHGHALARGIDPNRIMAELYGRKTGVSGGLGGSMHLFDVAQALHGRLRHRRRPHAPRLRHRAGGSSTGHATASPLCFIGDGAVNEGAFHESLNLAAVWKLPVLFFCENNLYGMGTAVHRVSRSPEIYKHAEAYGIPADQVDGMDVIAMHEAVDEALRAHARGEGPFFLEAI